MLAESESDGPRRRGGLRRSGKGFNVHRHSEEDLHRGDDEVFLRLGRTQVA